MEFSLRRSLYKFSLSLFCNDCSKKKDSTCKQNLKIEDKEETEEGKKFFYYFFFLIKKNRLCIQFYQKKEKEYTCKNMKI